ncbi:hypothetical protein FSP39_008797 [Pinctada imbricata]|uniref:Cadherin domain-containing protein n=1 Tax=Pinctada imbricata TaxID=66713 RepID=A0AA88YIS2_PINIB|nr:hypothetical protein FSP39_008797 [Pinctada imbricata]
MNVKNHCMAWYVQMDKKSHRGVNESHRGVVESHRGVVESHRGVVESHRGVVESHRGVVESHRGVVESHRGVVESHRGVVESHRGVVESHRGVVESHRGVVESHRSVVENSSRCFIYLPFTQSEFLDSTSNTCYLSEKNVTCNLNDSGIIVIMNNPLSAYTYYEVSMTIGAVEDFTNVVDSRTLKIFALGQIISTFGVVSTDAAVGQLITQISISSPYNLTLNSDYFEIDRNGNIHLARNMENYLDPRILSQLVTMEAMLTGSSTKVADIQILVYRSNFDVSVPENTIQAIVQIGTSDNFSYEMRCPIFAFCDIFKIRENEVKIVEEQDYEDNEYNRSFDFIVVFYRQNVEMAGTIVKVSITDENDNGPIFPKESNNIVVPLSVKETFIMNLHAEDVDSVGTLTYSLPPGNDKFRIRRDSQLWITSALNSSDVTISVTDGVNIPDTMNVYVTVEEYEEENLNKMYNKTMDEEIPAGYVVADVSDPQFDDYQFNEQKAYDYFSLDQTFRTKPLIEDKDLNTRLTYTLSNSLFTIESDPLDVHSFVLKSTSRIDREEIPFSIIEINPEVSDGTNSATMTVFVNVLDINDNSPEYQRGNYRAYFSAVTPLSLVSATDLDSGINGQLSFTLSLPNDFDVLTINPENGLISTKVIPESSRPQANVGVIYKATVTVSDNGSPSLSSSANLTLSVIAVSDNFTFSDTDFHRSIAEGTVNEHDIILMSEYFNGNTDVKYDIPGITGYETFSLSINESTGSVTLTGEVDRENMKWFIFPVRAKWGIGGAAIAIVNISIVDINDNPPKFLPGRSAFRLFENETSGLLIGTRLATDKDEGQNAQTAYFLRAMVGSPSCKRNKRHILL